jgi:uncharacterized membrane protein YbhN (UPF0104 family)
VRHGRLARIGFTAIVLVLLVVFATRMDWPRIWSTVRSSSFSLLALAALVHLASVLLKGVRWWVFLRPIGATSLPLALRATVAGAGLNSLLIANGGDAARAVFVSRAVPAPLSRVVATLAVERLFEMVGFALVLALAALFLELPPALDGTRPVAAVALLVLGGAVLWLVGRRTAGPAPTPSGAGRLARARASIVRLGSTMAEVCTGPRAAWAMALTVAVWGLQIATYHLTARAAHLDIPVVGTVAGLLAVNLGFAIRATPGSVGVFQALYSATAATFGMDPTHALATALLIQTQQMLPVTALGLALAPGFVYADGRARQGV